MPAPELKRRLTLTPEPLTLAEQLRRKLEGETAPAAVPDSDAALREPLLAYLHKEFLDEDSGDTLRWAFDWGFSDELADLEKHIQTLQADAELRRTYDVRGIHAKLSGLFRTVTVAMEQRVVAWVDVGRQDLGRFHDYEEAWSWQRHDMHPDEERALCEVIPVARLFSHLLSRQPRQHRSWWNSVSLAEDAGMGASGEKPLIQALEVGLNGFLLYLQFLSALESNAKILSGALADFEKVRQRIADHDEQMACARERRHAVSMPPSKERVRSAIAAQTTRHPSAHTAWGSAGAAATIATVAYDSDHGLATQINPATGLPMLDSVSDVQGNTFGTSNMDDMWNSGSGFGTPDAGYSSFNDNGHDVTAGGTGFGSVDDM